MKLGEKDFLINKAAYKYETVFKWPSEINQMWTNGMVSLRMGVTKIDIIYAKLIIIKLILILDNIISVIFYFIPLHLYIKRLENFIYLRMFN